MHVLQQQVLSARYLTPPVLLVGLKLSQLHSALLVLIQHNYVNCYLQSEDANPRRPPISMPLYEADLPAILQTLR